MLNNPGLEVDKNSSKENIITRSNQWFILSCVNKLACET